MSEEKDPTQEEFMKTFASLMGGMMLNESNLSISKEDKTIKTKIIEAKTVVIETPFDENDDIDLELAGEFYLTILDNFLENENKIKFGFKDKDYNYVGEVINFLTNIVETNDNGTKYIEGTVTDEIYEVLLKNSLNEIGRVKWNELYLIKDNNESLVIKKYGNEYIINNLNEKKINIISNITSDYFGVSYF